MIGNETTTGLMATLAAVSIIGGVDGLALWAGIVFSDLLEPLSPADRLDLSEIAPQLDPVRHGRLKLLQILARVLGTFAAKIKPLLLGARRHFAVPAIWEPFCRSTSIAPTLFHRPIVLNRHSFEPFWVFLGSEKP